MVTSISTVTVNSNEPVMITTAGPEILQAVYNTNFLTSPNIRPFYVVSPAVTPYAQGTGIKNWYPCQQGGIAFLPSAGTYWIRNEDDIFSIDILRIPVNDSADFGMYQQGLQPNFCLHANNLSANGDDFLVVAGILFNPDFYRRKIKIQNVAAAATILRVGINETPSATRGIAIPGGQSVDITDCSWQQIRIAIGAGAPVVATTAYYCWGP